MKVLFTTVYKIKKTKYDYFVSNTRNTIFRYTLPRIQSFGLRFIKQNIPTIEILEYPTWKEYKEKLNEGWDVIGFSFYLNEIPEILEMIEYARKKGVEEIWGGNYGALTPHIKEYFDWICPGYGEKEIARKLNHKFDEIVHPPLFGYFGIPVGFKLVTFGVLFTARGCNMHCSFCQTPSFCKKPHTIPIESIERVLRYYKERGVDQVIILDENFGMFKKHTEKVVELLGEYKFYWYPLARADIILSNFSFWNENGLNGAIVGVEAFSQEILDDLEKKEKVEEIVEAIKKMNENNMMIVGTYIIGYENERKEDIKKAVLKLKELKMDLTQICVLTPLPKTKLWEYIEEKYGIFEKDWHKFNAKHLVWNHPHIEAKEMEKILRWAFKKVYPRIMPFRTTIKFLRRYSERNRSFIKGAFYMLNQPIQANFFNYA